MREAEGVLAGELGAVGADELLLHQRQQVRLRALGLREHPRARRVEAAPFDRRVAQHRALAGLEAVDARREHGLQRRRQRRLLLLGLGRHELLEEQRVALGRVDDPAGEPRLEPGGADEAPRVRVREPLEHEL